MSFNARKPFQAAATTMLSIAVTLALVPPVAAVDRVTGSIRVSGPAYAARPGSDWATITAPRPLVAGDMLKTGKDGYLVADMGANGLIGLFGDSEVSTSDGADGLVVDVVRGKVAFHLEPNANVSIRVANATISSGEETADGYVERDAVAPPAVVMEGGTLDVRLPDGTTKTIATGERLELGTVTANIESGDDRRAAGAPSPQEAKPERRKYAGLSLRGWTAIAVVTAAVAGGAAALAGGGGGGGGSNGSPSGE